MKSKKDLTKGISCMCITKYCGFGAVPLLNIALLNLIMLIYFFCNIQQLHSIRSLHMAGDVGQMSCSSCYVHLISANIFERPDIYFNMFIVIVK